MNHTSLCLIDESPTDALRRQAIDQLHSATAIYTATDVVDDLLSKIRWPSGDGCLADCSAGDGQFLTRALTKLLTMCHVDDESLPKLIQGWEVHPAAAAQARVRVAAVLIAFGRPAAKASALADRIVHNRDFLTEGPTKPTFAAIASNPPYLRMANVPQLLRTEYGSVVPGYASLDLVFSFLDRCAKVLLPGGQIGFVVSDRWLGNSGAARLREALGARVSIEHLERLDARSTFYRPKQRRAGTPARVHPVQCVLGPAGRPITKAPIYPGVDPSRYAGYPTLDSIARVKLAPWLGTAGVFVLSRSVALDSQIPSEFLVPAVDTDDICGNLLGEPKRFAIRTSPDVEPCDAIMEHLRRQMHRMAPRGRNGKFYLPPERFHKMDLSQPSLLVPRIAKTPKAVRLPAGVLPLNHNLSIVSAGTASLDSIERALASNIAARWMRDHAPRLEDGYYSLCTTLLRKMPVDLG